MQNPIDVAHEPPLDADRLFLVVLLSLQAEELQKWVHEQLIADRPRTLFKVPKIARLDPSRLVFFGIPYRVHVLFRLLVRAPCLYRDRVTNKLLLANKIVEQPAVACVGLW